MNLKRMGGWGGGEVEGDNVSGWKTIELNEMKTGIYQANTISRFVRFYGW